MVTWREWVGRRCQAEPLTAALKKLGETYARSRITASPFSLSLSPSPWGGVICDSSMFGAHLRWQRTRHGQRCSLGSTWSATVELDRQQDAAPPCSHGEPEANRGHAVDVQRHGVQIRADGRTSPDSTTRFTSSPTTFWYSRPTLRSISTCIWALPLEMHWKQRLFIRSGCS